MAVNERELKMAIDKRAHEFKLQKDTITLKSVRRLLERDLGLENKALDGLKEEIERRVIEIISENSPKKKKTSKKEKISEPSKKPEKKTTRKPPKKKVKETEEGKGEEKERKEEEGKEGKEGKEESEEVTCGASMVEGKEMGGYDLLVGGSLQILEEVISSGEEREDGTWEARSSPELWYF